MQPAAVKATSVPDITAFMLEISDAISNTLELDQILSRIADIVKRVVDYQIFAILLVNERSQDMRVRFAVGHLPEIVENIRVKLGDGITGTAAATLEPQLVNDVRTEPRYIEVLDGVRSELAVPIVSKRRAIGVIDLQSREPDAFTDDHRKVLVLVASRIANAIENARLYRNAVTRERTLTLLNDISRELTSLLTLDELLKRTAELVRRVIDYQLFSVLLLDPRGEKLQHRLSVKFGQNVQIKHDVPLGKGIVGTAAMSREPVLVRDVTTDTRYISVNPEVRSELAVPLIYQDKVIGVLDLEHTRKAYFNETHARTLVTLAAQMAVSIANSSLYEQVVNAERRMERDLRLAQDIQKHLLPRTLPTASGLDIYARSEPARQLGGDLYDFFPYKGQKLGIAIGDVSGKGAGAALYGALVSGILRAQASPQITPAELLVHTNQALLQRRIEAQFMTLIYALWNQRSRRLLIANSGLPYPIACSEEGCRMLRIAGVPLGMLEQPGYDELALTLAPGEIVAFVSDGITEYLNPLGEEYGRVRLENTLRQHRTASARQIVQAIFTDVEDFAGEVPAADDRTVVVLKAQ